MKPKFDDTYQHKGLRRQLIQLLREKGITDEAVLEAMNNIPRHFFSILLLIKSPMKTGLSQLVKGKLFHNLIL